MIKTIEDDLFGTLIYDVFWEGWVDLPSLGGSIPIELGTRSNERPSERQKDLFSKFKYSCDSTLVSQISRTLCDYFTDLGHECKIDDMGDKISNPLIFIPSGVEKDPFVVVQWENDFDDEHGTQVVWREDGSLSIGIIGDD